MGVLGDFIQLPCNASQSYSIGIDLINMKSFLALATESYFSIHSMRARE